MLKLKEDFVPTQIEGLTEVVIGDKVPVVLEPTPPNQFVTNLELFIFLTQMAGPTKPGSERLFNDKDKKSLSSVLSRIMMLDAEQQETVLGALTKESDNSGRVEAPSIEYILQKLEHRMGVVDREINGVGAKPLNPRVQAILEKYTARANSVSSRRRQR